MKNKSKFSLRKIFTVLLVIAVVMLGLSMYAYLHRDTINENIKNQRLAEASAKSGQSEVPKSSPLPEELTNMDSITLFVDKTHTLAADYVPSDLTSPYLNSATDVIQLRQEAADKAKEMKQAAAEAGVNLIVSSGYRSYSEQADIYSNQVNMLGEAEASHHVASAGASEHQTGLALDFTTEDATTTNTTDFANTAAGQWLYEHAYEYGWILRYPDGKQDITGYSYMPWHYRYVGVDTATAMHAISPDETFEEYFNINQ